MYNKKCLHYFQQVTFPNGYLIFQLINPLFNINDVVTHWSISVKTCLSRSNRDVDEEYYFHIEIFRHGHPP